jgi:transcriptional regulator with XRE-family HTH domain
MDRPLLAETLRTLRTERGLSLVQLSEATGISSSFLSKVELGRSDITIGRLIRLAEFYDVDMTDLLAGGGAEPPADLHLLKESPENRIRFPQEGIDLYDLTGRVRREMVASLNVYAPGAAVVIADAQEREAIFFVLGGTFELGFEGDAPTVLSQGEGISLLSTRPYRIRNAGKDPGRILAMGVHPQ